MMEASTPARVAVADQWDCGNGHLQQQAALTMIRANVITDPDAIRLVDDLFQGAGPSFCAAFITEDLPF